MNFGAFQSCIDLNEQEAQFHITNGILLSQRQVDTKLRKIIDYQKKGKTVVDDLGRKYTMAGETKMAKYEFTEKMKYYLLIYPKY